MAATADGAGRAPEHARAALRRQGDRRLLRLGRCGQDHHRGRRGRHGRRRTSAARCSCSPSIRPGGWPTPSAWSSSATSRPGCPTEAFTDGGRRAPGRAVGRHARHQAVVGRPDPPPRPRRSHPRRDPGQPALPEHHRQVRPEPRLHRHGAALRDPRVGPLRPDRRGHPADPQRHRLPRRTRAHGRVLLVSRLLRWLIAPYKSRVVGFASKPFYSVADRILGTQFLEDIAEFFILFQTHVRRLRRAGPRGDRAAGRPPTTFLVVSHARGRAAPARPSTSSSC